MNTVPIRDVQPGDYVTVEEWIGSDDRSYTRDVLKVLAVDGNLLHVERISGKPYTITLHQKQCKIRESI